MDPPRPDQSGPHPPGLNPSGPNPSGPNPQAIGRYRIERVLGRGAMGVIYRAHDPDIDRTVAIKLIRADLLDGHDRPGFIARFRQEAQAAGRCSHPNIVAIYDFALHEGNPFLAMEFVDGVTLAQVREHTPRMGAEDAVFLMLQVLAALGAAHAMGVVHRDIKPANIMLAGGTQVKVADFGISRLDTSSLTGDGAVIGTPSYMSPEQCRGGALDARSDLFSAGVVLHELLAGAKPFAGPSAAAVINHILHDPAPRLELACPDLHPALAEVVARSLAKAPADRYATAGELAAALRSAAAEGGTAFADRTIIVPNRPAAVAAPTAFGSSLDGAAITTIERTLAEHVGPIARRLVQSAVRKSATLEALCASLAASIEQPARREIFQRDIQRQLSRPGSGSGSRTAVPAGTTISAAELERLQTELARCIGPVARVLVKRAAPGAASAAALWRSLAPNIEAPADRAAFLKKVPD